LTFSNVIEDLDMRPPRVVVTGISGNIGWGVAHALLARGVDVVGITRSENSRNDIVKSLGSAPNLALEVGDLSDAESASELASRIASSGEIDHVVAALGPWWQKGMIVAQPLDEYAKVRAGLQDSHVHAAMVFIPLLGNSPNASYTIISGQGANMAIPGTGLLVVAAVAVRGLSRMLRMEHMDDSVRVNEVLIGTRIEKTPREGVIYAPIFGAEIADFLNTSTRSAVLTYDGDKLSQTQ
jgi:NAD(P)-dependent dehydrogenase (short-subunit alcohol dehydrogenase family)